MLAEACTSWHPMAFCIHLFLGRIPRALGVRVPPALTPPFCLLPRSALQRGRTFGPHVGDVAPPGETAWRAWRDSERCQKVASICQLGAVTGTWHKPVFRKSDRVGHT
ncbi:unnamed protein product [Durusdinium trenchii]|uniref:Secreted protein n=1 Tax=Durusdinium trenchii TaxID=1381693 RepID=A0ABP0LX87_9DINO